VIRWLIRKLADRHHCRNTRLTFTAEKMPGYQAQVIVQMTDKCTGATYESAFTTQTAEQVQAALASAIRQAAEMGAA
jgi:hypothetical protein